MSTVHVTIGSWTDVEQLLRERPKGVFLRVPRSWLDHPKTNGMRLSAALPLGQTADYWKRLDEETGLHVSAYNSFYVASLQSVRQSRSENRSDFRGARVTSAVALGALFGAALGRSESSIVACAALAGGLFDAAIHRLKKSGTQR